VNSVADQMRDPFSWVELERRSDHVQKEGSASLSVCPWGFDKMACGSTLHLEDGGKDGTKYKRVPHARANRFADQTSRLNVIALGQRDGVNTEGDGAKRGGGTLSMKSL
jgi:hypothetical protein